MGKNKKESFFWTSYSDLMTSLFFVMLVLFVLVIVMLNKQLRTQEEYLRTQEVKLEEYEKIEEIRKSLENIDTRYFEYSSLYKKHILKINVNFPKGKSDINEISQKVLDDLYNAGKAIKSQIEHAMEENKDVQYLLIIEGQASKDSYTRNYELSYERALALHRYWQNSNIDFGKNCEVIIAGSGVGGTMRSNNESENQRFLIHIIPKTGEIKD